MAVSPVEECPLVPADVGAGLPVEECPWLANITATATSPVDLGQATGHTEEAPVDGALPCARMAPSVHAQLCSEWVFWALVVALAHRSLSERPMLAVVARLAVVRLPANCSRAIAEPSRA
jgi:hypothetical protein